MGVRGDIEWFWQSLQAKGNSADDERRAHRHKYLPEGILLCLRA